MPHKDPAQRAAYMRAYGKLWKQKNRGRVRANGEAHRRRNLKKFSLKAMRYMARMWQNDPMRARMKARLRELRARCKRQGIPYDLSPGDIDMPTHCPVLGIPLLHDRDGKRAIGGRKENSVSIDRIRPELGYVKGNVRVISWRANRLRNDATLWEMERVVEYMRGLGLDPSATSPFATLPERQRPGHAAANDGLPTSPSESQYRLPIP